MTKVTIKFDHPQFWETSEQRPDCWRCVLCDDGKNSSWRKSKNVRRHKESVKHLKAIRYTLGTEQQLNSVINSRDFKDVWGLNNRQSSPEHSGKLGSYSGTFRDSNLGDVSSNDEYLDEPQPSFDSSSIDFDYASTITIDHRRLTEDLELDNSDVQEDEELGMASVRSWLENGDIFGDEVLTDKELGSDVVDEDKDHIDNLIDDLSPTSQPGIDLAVQLRSISNNNLDREEDSSNWFPWPSKIHCILDILRHLPRSIFSDKQISYICWGMESLGISSVPSESVIKRLVETLQRTCGIKTLRYEGSLGHVFYMNDLHAIISQEMANPHVRPHLVFYPENTKGSILKDACQGQHWLVDMEPELLTPMIRYNNQDFYIFEPTILLNQLFCMPIRWYTREDILYGSAWRISPAVIRNQAGWIAYENETFEFALNQLATSFLLFANSFLQRHLPDPRIILGSLLEDGQFTEVWTRTVPERGNKWQSLARGHQVYAFPMLLYCDDTSRNSSKKWNKHNSFLFVAGGLPQKHIHYEYNVHFLSTSNIAPPLEMLEGIVYQLQSAQEMGIWAWDCILQDFVLLIPSVIALLGDNPMQSEFASHIGLMGKYFCRVCKVKRKDNLNDSDDDSDRDSEGASESASDAVSIQSLDGTDDDNAAGRTVTKKRKTKKKSKQKAKQKKPETLSDLVERATTFLKVAELRSKAYTEGILHDIYHSTVTLGLQSKAKKLRTDTGVKDTFQDYFLEMIKNYSKDLRGTIPSKQMKIDDFIKKLPSESKLLNPAWCIKGLDAHLHTPVEVLHVVLLGFTKYFWRDAMTRVTKAQKPLLMCRISSLDVRGLGISPLAGKTYVQYAGSLVGRDFRIVSQIAPFVLYDLVPDPCYEAWVALAYLVPLIFQPVIKSVDRHIVSFSNISTEYSMWPLCPETLLVNFDIKTIFAGPCHLPNCRQHEQ